MVSTQNIITSILHTGMLAVEQLLQIILFMVSEWT